MPTPLAPLQRDRCLFHRAAALGLCFTLAASVVASAGDILRGGAPAGIPGRGGTGRTDGAGTEPLRQNAKDALARTTQALQSVKAMQAAAREAAKKGANNLGFVPKIPGQRLPDVPNGLAIGGLQVAPGVPLDLASPQPGENAALWQGAKLPKQTVAGSKTTVTIEQLTQQALLTWRTFNIGKETTLKFDQSKGGKDVGKWIAVNKIEDPSGLPSQILGAIEAQGQVYVLNQNGILFGGSSQINVHGLVASSLPINNNLLQRGLLNNPDEQFLFSSLSVPALPTGATMPAFNPPPAPNTPDGKPGDVVVQKGAKLSAPTTADHVGGRIALIGPNVKNEGTISTPDGQTILAAGQQVAFRAHASSDPTLRGLDVFVGTAGEGTGSATNGGLIEAQRGATTIVGKNVNQLGAIDSSTSVSLNGRIDLLANYNTAVTVVLGKPKISPTATGTVTLGAGSVTRILPETWSNETVVGTQLALNSQFNAQGRAIHFDTGAQLLAPSANVTLSAGTWQPLSGSTAFTFDKGQIYLDAGASINVAGSIDVAASITQNILALQLLGSELADSPLQRTGPLRAVDLFIDIRKTGTFNGFSWVGTPLGDASGYVGLVQRTVGQLTTTGGTVKLNSGTSVVMQPGSAIDVSGGWVNYDGGVVQTTRVMSGGQIIDISQATPDRIYDGIYTGQTIRSSGRWNITETFSQSLALTGAHYEPGYTQGANGGSISITAPSVALDGALLGNTIAGVRQRSATPAASSFSLVFQSQDASNTLYLPISPTPPDVTFGTNTLAPAAAFALDANGDPVPLRVDRRESVILSPELLTSSGFGSLTIDNSDGNISVPAGITLATQPGGTIKLAAANLDIAGNVIAPSGSLSFSTFNISPYVVAALKASATPTTPPPNAGRGTFTLASGATLSTAGFVIDDRPYYDPHGTLPLSINGGAITISGYSADLASGSAIDVSGGVVAGVEGKISYGSAGSIAIKTGQDPNVSSVLGGKLHLGATLSGFSGSVPGALSVQAPLIQIGGTTTNANTLLLSPDFFSRGGFGSFTLTALGAKTAQVEQYLPSIVIAPGTIIEPVVKNWLAQTRVPGTGGLELAPFERPDGLRTPASLSFLTPGVRDEFSRQLVIRGDLVLGAGSLIRTDPRGSVRISGDTANILGSIVAPAGSISISGGSSFAAVTPTEQPLTTVFIGAHSVLSTAGAVVLTPDVRGFRTGAVLPGGSISVSGNIVASAGTLLDVSGTSGELDVHPSLLAANATSEFLAVPTTSGLTTPLWNYGLITSAHIDSDAGSITLKGGQSLFSDATLLGAAGGSQALGGKLTVSSGKFVPPGDNTPPTPLDVNLVVQQSGHTIPVAFTGSAIGKAVLDQNGTLVPGLGYFVADRFAAGGFDSLTLKGTVKFNGPVTIDANRSLSIADAGVIFADSAVNLSAPYVALGTTFLPPLLPEQKTAPFLVGGQPFNFSPTYGAGSLTVHAQLIDIGNLSLQGIGKASFIADGGDIRGDGTLDVAGDIYLRAGQIYPPTAVSFTISASDYTLNSVLQSGSVTIAASGTRALPYSAGGTLNVFASTINQGGVLRAPLGAINLGWDGTGTAPVGAITGHAVASTEQLTMGDASVTSVSAIEPVGGKSLVIPYGLEVNGVSWIDPAGIDITAGGVPGKKINISAASIVNQPGAVIDIRGGGDLYAFRWVKGVGGSRDLLASTTSFAIIPGYGADYSPYAPFNPSTAATNLGGDPGYVNSTLSVGDRIFLSGGGSLEAGTYTLLPARYALLLGAFLVTPKSGAPLGSFQLVDDSWLVSGYRLGGFNSEQSPMLSRFEVVTGSDVRDRAEYADYLAGATLRQGALALGQAPPRLPGDAGQLVLQATTGLTLQGIVKAQGVSGSRGGLVDISSPVDIVIGHASGAGQLVLDSGELSKFGAESLLIGGTRTVGTNGTTVTVKTGSVTVDNSGTPLRAPEVILVAKQNLTLADGAAVVQSGSLAGGADTLLLNGDGVLLRVSADASAPISRTGMTGSTTPNLTAGANAVVSGASVTLDSSAGMSLDASVALRANAISLNSGRVSIQLENPGALQPDPGLVLTGSLLTNLQSARSLSLLSYSSIDVYGAGSFGAQGSLALSAGEIRGFNTSGGTVAFSAPDIVLENRANVTGPGANPLLDGTVRFTADTITLGANQLRIDQFATVSVDSSEGILARGAGGLTVQGDFTATTPVITATKQSTQSIIADGALTLASGGAAKIIGGLGASLTLQGASVTASTDVLLPSGQLTIRARTQDLVVNGKLDASGTGQTFFDVVKFTDAGSITLTADAGAVTLGAGSEVSVAAASGGAAGKLAINSTAGAFTLAGAIHGEGGGRFSLDAGSLPSFGGLATALAAGGFSQEQTIRVRTGDVLVDAAAKAHVFNLSADQGAITVASTIDASGARGGSIALSADGSVTLLDGSKLTVAADEFDAAGKGGAVRLETRTGTVDIQTGSTIDLRVTAAPQLGDFTGTLHLRAPQISGGTDLAVNAINGSVLGASKIVAEGFSVFDLTGSGAITSAVQTNVFNNGTIFGGAANAIAARLLTNNASLASALVVTPGAEIINRTGSLTLGTTGSTATSDWNLATFRFGPKNAAGGLTLRASGDIVFFNALSDGFATSAYNSALLAQNTLLPTNAQSYSYRMTAGADFAAADFARVSGTGSLKLGKDAGIGIAVPFGANAQTSTAVNNRFQVIRTGTGDIDISVGGDVQLLNQFATIYTAGTPVLDATMGGTFDLPILNAAGGQTVLGAIQQNPAYPAQYTLAGGNISIAAGNDIVHLTKNNAGQLVADSERELPTNWLYRRGYVDPLTGEFGAARFGDIASTTWWVDFSNFFEGIGALGGGNVTMTAGRDIANVDAVIPTNARMPKGAPNASTLVELGGGDLTVRAGRDLDAGVYYVERGSGTLAAGGSIRTNATRSPSLTNLTNQAPLPSETWLPTTLFLGKGSFDVSARGDVLLGPTANPFLLPGGYNNTYWYKTYFSTYATSDAVSVSSLGGNVTLRQSATLPIEGLGGDVPLLQTWLENVLLFRPSTPTASFYQPWLRLDETSITPFTTALALLPATLRATAFSGDLNLIGNLTLSPSPTGTIDLAAAGAINGLQINGQTTINGAPTKSWGTSRINLSDTSPSFIFGVTSPNAYQSVAGTVQSLARSTGVDFLKGFDALFAESGATTGAAAVLQTKQALHAPSVLHTGDTEPVRLYAAGGDISGISLFSGKAARVIAGRDVSDVALYVQNVSADDITLVASGRDVIAFNDNSPLRVLARSAGSALNFGDGALAGDIQISGPGTLEVLAGRNLDLGIGPSAADGTALGMVSIGNARNPYLPFDGAQIVAGAGIGPATGLASGRLDVQRFIDEVLTSDVLDGYLGELNVAGVTSANFKQLPAEQQAVLAVRMFYLVLRDAGRESESAEKGFEAIDTLFPGTYAGDISLTAREIKTRSGGDINLFAPGGKLTVGFDVAGAQPLDQGILTEAGGNIHLFTHDDVIVGTSRIFTLRGGNEIIWSSEGDIAAGSSAKTVQSAPPTRVLIDPQSGDVQTDLAGLATGGGIGVLATVAGVPPADVDLIAPKGTVDAGDAGVRASGNLNVAAASVVNASQFSAGGTSSGTPSGAAAAPAAPVVAAPSSTAATNNAANQQAATQQRAEQPPPAEESPSIFSVEVIGYGGETPEEDERRRRE